MDGRGAIVLKAHHPLDLFAYDGRDRRDKQYRSNSLFRRQFRPLQAPAQSRRSTVISDDSLMKRKSCFRRALMARKVFADPALTMRS